MNVGQIKTKTTQVIREFSNNGTLIGSGDNADYLKSMNGFINDAQFELNSKIPIIRKITLGSPISQSQVYNRYAMPSDYIGFKELKNGDFKFTDYDFEDEVLLIPIGYDSTFTLWYYAEPTIIDDDTPDSADLEIKTNLQLIIPYFVASHVIIDENPQLSDFFLAEYKTKKREATTKKTQRRVKPYLKY